MAFKVLQVDHIGIGVNDLAATKEFYKNALGIEHLPEDEIVEEQKVKVSFFPCGDAELEFLETTTPDGPIGKFIEKMVVVMVSNTLHCALTILKMLLLI